MAAVRRLLTSRSPGMMTVRIPVVTATATRRAAASLLTPRPTSGSRSWSTSGQRAPVDGDAAARAVHREQRERRARRSRSSSTVARARGRRGAGRRPTKPRARRRRRAPARRARRGRRRRGRGGHGLPGEQHDPLRARARRRRRAPARCRSPSLSTGWRTTSACSVAHASPAAETESRSPTRTAGASPAARAWSSPPSAAMTTRRRDRGDGAPVERRRSGDHDDRARSSWIPPPALPGSGSRVGGGGHPLSPPIQ